MVTGGARKSHRYYCECYQVQKLLYMLDQVRTTTCPRKQHAAEAGEAYYFMSERTSVPSRQSLRGFVESNLHSGPGAACQKESSCITEQSRLHRNEELPKSQPALAEGYEHAEEPGSGRLGAGGRSDCSHHVP